MLGFELLGQVAFSSKELGAAISFPKKSAVWQMFLLMFAYFMLVLLAESVGFLPRAFFLDNNFVLIVRCR